MINLIAFTMLSCPTTKIVNHTDVWSEYDKSVLNTAKVRCNEIYPGSPCVKVFIKKEEQLYNVVCGSKVK